MATDSSNKVPNVPPLRFPEFSGELERTKLCKYLREHTERNRMELFSKNDVLSVSGDLGVVNQIELLGRSFAGKSVRNYHVVRTGNVVYTKSPLKEYPYGIIKVNRGIDGIVSTLYAVYGVKDNADGRFIEYYFSGKGRINRYLKPIVRIGAKHDMKIGNEEVLQNYVSFPKLIEQHKIASFIEIINKRIATQSKIIDKLQSLMSGIRAKLLSHTFLGDSIKLSELGKLKNGYAFKSSTYIPNGRYNIITIANVSGDRFIVGEYNRIEILPDDIQEHQILSDDNILISLTGNVGRVSLNRGTNNLLNQRVGLFELYNNELHEFVYQSISAQAFENSMRLKAQGAAQMNIGKNDVEDYEIPYTANKRLLDKVSSMLQYIDERIILAETLNVQYKSQKLYLLQQMFI